MTTPSSGPRLVLPLAAWLLISHLLVLVLPVLAAVGTGALARDLALQTRIDLLHQAELLGLLLEREMGPGEPAQATAQRVGHLLQRIQAETGSDARLLAPNGQVLGGAGEMEDARLEEHPEVQAARAGIASTRAPAAAVLDILGRSGPLVVARPVPASGPVRMVVVLSHPPRNPWAATSHLGTRLGVGAMLALLLTTGLGIGGGLWLNRSMGRVVRAADRLAEGDFAAVSALSRPASSHIAETRMLAHSFVAMAERLQHRLRYIQDFAGHVSHEFRTPLSSLQGSIELLRDEPEMPVAQRERFLDNAARDVSRMVRMVRGLMELARAEEAAHREEVDLDLLLRTLQGEDPGIEVSGEAGRTWGDRAQLEAVLRNLVDNAFQHGGDAVKVQVRGVQSPGLVGFEVEDDGPGVSARNLDRVFDRFFTTDRERGGTGLGLALVEAICRAHGGSVQVESRPGRTVFRVRLPEAQQGQSA